MTFSEKAELLYFLGISEFYSLDQKEFLHMAVTHFLYGNSLTVKDIFKNTVQITLCFVYYYSAIKKNGIMLFVAIKMQLEIILLSEVKKRKANTL